MLESRKNDMLKLIAVITMTIDHVGALFFPQMVWLRVIGRLAFPIFAYQVALGFEKTGNKRRYMVRMLVWAVITILPFYGFAMETSGNPRYQNVLFTFFFALVVLTFLEQRRVLPMLAFGVAPLVVLEYVGITFDYGLYGVAVVVIFYLFKKKEYQLVGIFGATIVYLLIRMAPRGIPLYVILSNIQLLSLFAVLLIHRDWTWEVHLPKYFFYLYYPAHMALLVFIHNQIFI
jgi:hypothetical protein